MIKTKKWLLLPYLFSLIIISFISTYVFANDEKTGRNDLPVLSLSFDINDKKQHELSSVLEDGTIVTVGAEYIEKDGERSLSGEWRIYGSNGLATMEYYIQLIPYGNYTKISDAYGLAVSGVLTSYENETINIVRRIETSSLAAIVEGYAKFNYFGNQWISLWTKSGGVRARIKNDVITTELY